MYKEKYLTTASTPTTGTSPVAGQANVRCTPSAARKRREKNDEYWCYNKISEFWI